MDIKLTQKIIKDRCGKVSYKKGEAFFRGNKVILEKYERDYCEAKVHALEYFYVTIQNDGRGGFHADCSCPKLASFQKDCQHIAAVLHAIYHQQQNVLSKRNEVREQHEDVPYLFSLFEDQTNKMRSRQKHFDQRKILHLDYLLQLIILNDGAQLIGVGLKLESRKVKDIRGFLAGLRKGRTTSFYNPSEQCFKLEDDAVLQQLIQLVQDEQLFSDHLSKEWGMKDDQSFIMIPPSSWEILLPLLSRSQVSWEHTNECFNVVKVPPSLKFIMVDSGEGCKLSADGLDELIVLKPYHSVIKNGTLSVMNQEDFDILFELTRMFERSGKKELPIAKEQIKFFVEKIVPNLRNLGEVEVSPSISATVTNIPLVAKLYLDRVGNRLLAGLEFHYEQTVINPLEQRDDNPVFLFTRDRDKEDAILKLIEAAKFSSSGQGYFLQNEELEYEFLVHIIPRLEKLVQIYATTAVRNRIFKGNDFPKIRVKMKKERTNWLEFKFEMDGIPDKEIRDVLQALEEKRKYYRLRNGTLLSLETREYEEIQSFLKAAPKQQEEFDTFITMPIIRGLSFVHHDIFEYEKSFSDFLKNLQHPEKMMGVAIPDSIDGVLHDYQKIGYKWMKTLAYYGFGGILADDMGLGKTIQAISYILSELPNIRNNKEPILVVSPSSLTYQWLGELMKFAPEVKAQVIDGNKAKRDETLKMLVEEETDVYITSYPILRRDIKWYKKQKFHTIFFDEAQAFKNPYTQTAKSVKLLNADHRFALTGTPVENSLEELWSIFHVVFPELFLGLKEYSELSRKMISQRIRPFMLRRLKEDVLSDLPEKESSIEAVDLLPEQKKLYAAYLAKLRHDTLKHLDKDTLRKNKIKILAGLTRLRQICCHPALFVHNYQGSSAKFEQLQRIIKESQQAGRKVLIFSQFTKMLQIIGRELAYKGVPFFYLDGQTPVEERLKTCHRYNSGERPIFLISLKAGGTGLNLTGADTVILYDNWWNPAVEEQAEDRAHRMGQKKVVEVIKLVSRGTIEEKMNELQEKKRLLIHETIDRKNKEQYTLTEEDIREIFNI